MMISYNNIKALYENNDYKFYIEPYNINIFGIRHQGNADKFDDIIGVAWVDDTGKANAAVFAATTKPGVYYLEKPMNIKGTAILKAGYHKSLWTPGDHRGYRALIQNRPCTVYRDNDKDDIIEMIEGTEETGMFGIDLHKQLTEKDNVGQASAGCQVLQHISDFIFIMGLVDKQISAGIAPLFSYALFNDTEI